LGWTLAPGLAEKCVGWEKERFFRIFAFRWAAVMMWFAGFVLVDISISFSGGPQSVFEDHELGRD